MMDLFWWQYALIGLIFIWSGFVRSGLGFGGAVLSLPFLLLIVNDPLIFLPIISIHLLIFSSWIAWRGSRAARLSKTGPKSNIDWPYLKTAISIMLVPKMIGVFGLLTLPGQWVTLIIFAIISLFAISYILNKPFYSDNPWLDKGFLMLGGYVSGTSLIGAPLIVSVFAKQVHRDQLRDTLFVLWFILVSLKMLSFIVFDVDLQLFHQLWLFPCALLGHLGGELLYQRLRQTDSVSFFRFIGWALLIVCGFGIYTGLMLS